MYGLTLIFFLSGLSALVYQLLWMRQLGFIFGNTIYASSVVLTAFMGGLALGSHWFGRVAQRLREPIKVFALLEWTVAGYALILPFLFNGMRGLYVWAYQHVSSELWFLTPFRFVLAILLLLVPTVCMGATLPVLMRGVAYDETKFGARMAWLYGVNTLGAVAGVMLSGFYLIPTFGLTRTNQLAAGSEVLAGLAAWFLAHRFRAAAGEASLEPRKVRWPDLSAEARSAIVLATLCGFVSLALEVVWYRALILVFGSTTYSFTVMLSVFLLGMALGSMLISPFLDRLRHRWSTLCLMVAAVGLYTFWSMYRFDGGPEFLLNHLVRRQFTWAGMMEARFLIALSHLAVPALLFGAAFSLATRMVRHDAGTSSGAVGLVYALNTVGAVAGSFAGGFILLPHLGMENSLLAVALLAGVGGLLALVLTRPPALVRVVAVVAIAAFTAMALVAPPRWNKSMLAAGAFFSPFNFIRDGRVVFREQVAADRLLHYREALSSTVSVHISDNEQKYFCVDGKTEADQGTRGMVVQRMIGHLPMLFHPHARTAMNLGLGAGVSFGALGCHPLDHLEVVEIEPAVSVAARTWGPLNHHVLDNPRAILTFNDGRNHLLSTTNVYDVITSDPFEPVVGGASHLFTVEHFAQARARLAPDGIMGQWIPMYEMSPEDYLTIVRSFVHVFPDTALFYTGFDTLLLGFKGKMKLEPEVLRRNYAVPAVRDSLSEVGFTAPEMILGMFVADLSRHPEFVGSGPLNTDEHPIIEFSTPKSAMRYTTDENQAALLAHFTPIPEAWLAGLEPEVAERLQREHEAVRLMLEAAVLRARGETEPSFLKLSRAREISPGNPVVRNEIIGMLTASARQLSAAGQPGEAAHQYQTALQLDPDDFWSLHALIGLAMQAGDTETGGRLLRHARARYPDSPLLLGQEGKYLFTQGDREQGLNLAGRAASLHPGNRGLWQDVRIMAELAGDAGWQARAQEALARLDAFIQGRDGLPAGALTL